MSSWVAKTLRQAAWAPILVLVAYAVAAKGFNAYILVPDLDIPTHFAGGSAIAYFFVVGIGHAQGLVGRVPAIIQSLLALGLTAIAAVLWELLEFSADAMLGTTMNLGVSDTLSDLFFGLLGGVVAIAIAARIGPLVKDP